MGLTSLNKNRILVGKTLKGYLIQALSYFHQVVMEPTVTHFQ